jgi:exopolysaccharide biosynthesis polyprenyl glycosylphosphotransferase
MRLPLWPDEAELWPEDTEPPTSAGDDDPQANDGRPSGAGSAAGRTATRDKDLRTGLLDRLVITDVLALQCAWWLAVLVYPVGASIPILLLAGAVNTVVGLGLLTARHLYRSRVAAVRQTEVRRLGLVAIGSSAASYLVLDVAGPEPVSGWHLALTTALSLVVLTVGRSFFDEWLRAQRSIGRYQRPIVIAGNGDEVQYLIELLNDHPDFGLAVREVVRTIDVEDPTLVRRVENALDRTGSHGVLLTSQGLAIEDKRTLISVLAQKGVHVHLSSGLWGIDYRRVRAVPVAHEPLLYVEPADTRRSTRLAKRSMDLVGALVLLVVSAPLLLLAAIAILLEDGSPVLFRQRRVGRYGVPFDMFKLRSMDPDAEQRIGDVKDDNERQGPLYKNDGSDPRITKVGRIIRALSIDELPQIFNVLRGEMSLVGPRPALPQEVEEFDTDLRDRLRAKPGITGLWQVEARDNPSFSAYKRLDLLYTENRSSMMDLVILLMTVQSVLGRAIRMIRRRSFGLNPSS